MIGNRVWLRYQLPFAAFHPIRVFLPASFIPPAVIPLLNPLFIKLADAMRSSHIKCHQGFSKAAAPSVLIAILAKLAGHDWEWAGLATPADTMNSKMDRESLFIGHGNCLMRL